MGDMAECCAIFAKEFGGIDIYAEDSAHPQVESPDVLPNTEKATIEKDVSEAMMNNFRAHSMVAKYHEGGVDSDDEGPEDDGSDDDIGHLEHAWEMLEMARMIWSKAGLVDPGQLLRPTTGLALLWLMWTTGLVLRQLSTKPWMCSTSGSTRSR